jgi:(1->4)-alpha-D-glucan 1-alpha-D-glucosylmutase
MTIPPEPVGYPRATYRLQFGPSFGFRDAQRWVPYLSKLGISHLYASPLLAARPGSTHGYDIVDHNRLNPELGDPSEFYALVDILHREGMGLILDFVPNHMGIGEDNPWWAHVLEWGRRSPWSRFFDIDWEPLELSLSGKILLPVLADHYGAVLERGELRPELDPEKGAFSVRYGDARFPLSPRDYPAILQAAADRSPEAGPELKPIVEGMVESVKRGRSVGEEKVRRERVETLKGQLARVLTGQGPEVQALADVLEELAGREGEPDSFEALHRLLERQSYRLAYWRVAAHEINYRRFFDINDLAGLRMEEPELFQKSHALVGRLVDEGRVQGLRLDHVDGLRDPGAYLRTLRTRVGPQYLVVEKILASDERLREEWPVDGTTGYEFMTQVNGLLVDPAGEKGLTRTYQRFVEGRRSFQEVDEASRRVVMQEALVSELNVLANVFNRLAKESRATRDHTLTGIRQALVDIVVQFPVYRTYVTSRGEDPLDREVVDRAVDRARRRSRQPDTTVYDFIREVLTLDLRRDDSRPRRRHAVLEAALRFQQYTGPVMAKAVEDTAFYRYLRLVSLNEVGGDPGTFGLPPEAFHEGNRRRLEEHPGSMVTTATHDHKRGEDLRARLAVLSEIPGEWAAQVNRWGRINRKAKTEVDGRQSPSRDDEYLFYQTVVGAWPPDLSPSSPEGVGAFRERVAGYMEKAAREANVHTGWLVRNEAYEEALARFVRHLLDPGREGPFLEEVAAFARRIGIAGAVNGLAQLTLKLTVPGVPDQFQGTEFWDLSLVDPDNRRLVDDGARAEALARSPAGPEKWKALLEGWPSGEVKLHLMHRLLELRRHRPFLLLRGKYQPLPVSGEHAHRVVAFARTWEGETLVVVVPRLVEPLVRGLAAPLPDGWEKTMVTFPEQVAGHALRDPLSGHRVDCGHERRVPVQELLALLPVAAVLAPADERW